MLLRKRQIDESYPTPVPYSVALHKDYGTVLVVHNVWPIGT